MIKQRIKYYFWRYDHDIMLFVSSVMVAAMSIYLDSISTTLWEHICTAFCALASIAGILVVCVALGVEDERMRRIRDGSRQ